ncbi:CD44 antigen isoform X1 [Gopherus flavomarginatus]|uniref:CD44 antigen isoform X1 n=1 Tax=Gopherus flavomarginatus TaxID=286002 RepID=UPI0021CBF6EA|nr:CD44 antigen isoform X1 [Gopherus flavomarginatus]
MSRFLLCATFGLCLLQLCLAEIQFNISCRYGGVFHVEKNRRYSLTRDEAVELCKALNSTLPTMDQMKKAHNLGFETCRYGYIEDKIVIPRIKPYFLCAANNTGIYILTSNITDRYDTYCYNASETREKACEPIIRLDVSGHDNQSQIVIDNADGSRYTDGVKHTDPTPVTDDNHVGSGSIHDGDATNPTIIGPHMTGASYYEDITPDALSTDYSSGSGRKEDHPTSTNDIATPFDDKWGEDSTVISLITDGVPGKDSDHPSKGRHPASTTVVVSSEGAKNEDATQDPLLHNVYLGVDEDEDKYPINTTVDSVKPAHFPVKERDHSSSSVTVNNEIGRNTYTPTAVVVSSEGAKNEDATQDPLLHNVYLGVDEDEDKYPINTTVDSVKPAHFPVKERDHSSSSVTVNNEIGRNTYTPTAVVVSSEGAKNEDATQDPLLHNVYLGVDEDEDKYPINTTVDSVKPAHFPVKERDHSSSSVTVNNEIGRNTYTPTVVVSNEGAKNEDPTQDPLLNGAHPGWSDKVKYSTNTTRNGVLPGVIPSHESEQSTTAMVSNGEAKHEDSTQDPLLHTVHPGWGNADKYPTNVTRNDVLPGIIPPSENDQEKESSHTAVTSNDGAIYEDSTHDSLPLDNQPEWGSEDKYPTNTSRDYVIPGLIPENEAESYTAVVSNDGATHEDSTQDPLLHSVHPGWGNEDKYLTATSRDDVLPGMIPPSETEHKNDSSHTAVVSNDGIKHEDSTKDPLTPGIHLGGENEDKYPTNNPIDNLIPGVFSDIESGHGRGPASTVTSSTLNKHDGRRANPSGQVTKPNIASQPRSAQIPEWLIIVASLLALTLILAVCIAVNSRSRCGQKKKLVINNGKGSVSDKKMGGLNGEASKSQEMVHLVHKEQPDNRTGSCDEFLTTDETKNPQEANMKTGM